MKRHHPASLASLILLTALASSAQAVEMYRWVDAEGRTHVADVVPAEYLKTARRVDSAQFDLAPAEKLAANRQAAALKVQAESVDQRLERSQRSAVVVAKSEDAASSSTDTPQCGELWRRYREAQTCFTSRTRRNGTTGPMRICDADVQDPTPQCGPDRSSR